MSSSFAATTVAAQGEAKSDFNLANFVVYLSGNGDTVPTAKDDLKKKVDNLLIAIGNMTSELGIKPVKNSIVTTSNVQELREWVKTKEVFKGYQADYSYQFQIDDLTQVSKVYDMLTMLAEVRVSSPTYSLKNKDKLNKKALKNAFEKVVDRFQVECDILGLVPADFEILTWEATYSDSRRSEGVMRRASRAMAAAEMTVGSSMNATDGGSASEPLELVAGQATVVVNLVVAYSRKSKVGIVNA